LEDLAEQSGIEINNVAETEIQEKELVKFELIRGIYRK